MKLELTADDIPHSALEKAISEAVKEKVEDLQLLTAKEAAAFLKVPVPTFRDIAKREQCGNIDLGPRGARWSIKQLRALIAKREVKAVTSA
jgi:hypothetical protein